MGDPAMTAHQPSRPPGVPSAATRAAALLCLAAGGLLFLVRSTLYTDIDVLQNPPDFARRALQLGGRSTSSGLPIANTLPPNMPSFEPSPCKGAPCGGQVVFLSTVADTLRGLPLAVGAALAALLATLLCR
eukprot:EG_transcript_46945